MLFRSRSLAYLHAVDNLVYLSSLSPGLAVQVIPAAGATAISASPRVLQPPHSMVRPCLEYQNAAQFYSLHNVAIWPGCSVRSCHACQPSGVSRAIELLTQSTYLRPMCRIMALDCPMLTSSSQYLERSSLCLFTRALELTPFLIDPNVFADILQPCQPRVTL